VIPNNLVVSAGFSGPWSAARTPRLFLPGGAGGISSNINHEVSKWEGNHIIIVAGIRAALREPDTDQAIAFFIEMKTRRGERRNRANGAIRHGTPGNEAAEVLMAEEKQISKRQRGWALQRNNQRVFKRDKYLCQMCKRKGYIRAAEEVDHIIPLFKGGTDDMNNLQSLCKECHQAKTRADLSGKHETGINGMPIGGHWWNDE